MPDDRLLFSVEEVAHQLSLGKTKVWELVNQREIASVRVGRRVLVPGDALKRYVTTLTEQETP